MPQEDDTDFYKKEFMGSLVKKEDLSDFKLELITRITGEFEALRKEIKETDSQREGVLARATRTRNALIITLSAIVLFIVILLVIVGVLGKG